VPDQAGRTTDHGNAAHHRLGNADLAKHRGDRTRGIDGDVPAVDPIHLHRQGLQGCDVASRHALAGRNLEQPGRAGIVGPVVGMTEAMQRLALLAKAGGDLRRTGLQAFRSLQHLVDQHGATFHGADEGAAYAEQTRSHCRLKRFRRRVVDQAGDDRAGREAMLHERDQHCIEQHGLGAGRPLPGELEQHHLGKAEMTHQVIDQALAPDGDAGLVSRADLGGGCGAGIHVRSPERSFKMPVCSKDAGLLRAFRVIEPPRIVVLNRPASFSHSPKARS